jgi:NAD(P)H-flavin reductase
LLRSQEHLASERDFVRGVQSDSGEEIAFKLNSYWSDLEHIHVNEEVRFVFSEQEQRQIYYLEEFKELRVLIKPETRRYPFDNVGILWQGFQPHQPEPRLREFLSEKTQRASISSGQSSKN